MVPWPEPIIPSRAPGESERSNSSQRRVGRFGRTCLTMAPSFATIVSVSSIDIWGEPVVLPMVTTGRRRTLGRWLAAISALSGALGVVGSCLPWTYYFDGGDSTPLTISGLNMSELGAWTLILGAGLILAGLLSSLFISRLRSSLPALVAASGLAVSADSCVRHVTLGTGQVVRQDPQTGLALVVAAYSFAVAATVVLWALDWRWYGPDSLTSLGRRRTPTPPDTSLLAQ